MNAIGVKLGNGWYSREQHGEKDYGKKNFLFFCFTRIVCLPI
jgi:hypothetical protein